MPTIRPRTRRLVPFAGAEGYGTQRKVDRADRRFYTSKVPKGVTLKPEDQKIAQHDRIRVLAMPGSGLFRDGMTVEEFFRRSPSVDEAKHQIFRCRKMGLIGIEAGTPPSPEGDDLGQA